MSFPRLLPALSTALLAAFSLLLLTASAHNDGSSEDRLPFCPPKGDGAPPINRYNGSMTHLSMTFSKSISLGLRNSNVLLVSTLDGKIRALDPTDSGSVLWEVATGDGDMLSSTLSQLELSKNGQFVRLIPSLAGGLYR